MNGRSIRIFFVDGDASGLLTAEVMNWSGKMLASPWTKLAELANREEIARTGIYIWPVRILRIRSVRLSTSAKAN